MIFRSIYFLRLIKVKLSEREYKVVKDFKEAFTVQKQILPFLLHGHADAANRADRAFLYCPLN